MWELDYKEGWVPKNWYIQTVVLEKALESPLDSKDIQPVNPKGNKSWIFIGRTDAEAEVPILWPPDAKSQLNWKRSWWWERLRAGGEVGNRGWDGWMASLTQWTGVWVNSGRLWRTGVLTCCSPGDHKESDMTEWLNNNNIENSRDDKWGVTEFWYRTESLDPPMPAFHYLWIFFFQLCEIIDSLYCLRQFKLSFCYLLSKEHWIIYGGISKSKDMDRHAWLKFIYSLNYSWSSCPPQALCRVKENKRLDCFFF